MSNQPCLADQIWEVWQRLGPDWAPYFKEAGLALSLKSKKAFLRDLHRQIKVNFRLKGLEEFSRSGRRGIEPADPALSLFYHIFASPYANPPGVRDDCYPTIADLEVIENYIYSVGRPSIQDLQVLQDRIKGAGELGLAIVVFAYEYATAGDTVHGRYADLCFSRTGIGRVGNAPPNYVAKARGYFPASGSKENVHVVPARFAAFIAHQVKGNKTTIGPLHFEDSGDQDRNFWVPLYKLFDGPECIEGLYVDLKIQAHHLNEKIRRIHLSLTSRGFNTGWTKDEMNEEPFRITRGLAKEFDKKTGLVVPVPHDPMIEPARTADGRFVGFPVPPYKKAQRRLGFPVPYYGVMSSTPWFQAEYGARHSPEFVHAKHMIVKEGGQERIVYLPDQDQRNIVALVKRGKYLAANFIDWSADGWVGAACPALQHFKSYPAYSILAQPDFFPLVKQQDLKEWLDTPNLPRSVRDSWSGSDAAVTPLSDARFPANFMLKEAGFDSTDQTMTAIVGMNRRPRRKGTRMLTIQPFRESTLSVRASGLFEPGWDVTVDLNSASDAAQPTGTYHLAHYGLGSPYPEDTLLCAALSSYWPGAAPDVSRFFKPSEGQPSVTPILDQQANWDGGAMPKMIVSRRNAKKTSSKSANYEYESLAYADYVRDIWKGRFSFVEFAYVSLEDYKARTLASARIFQHRGVETKARWQYPFMSFKHPSAKEFDDLLSSKWGIARDQTFRVEVAKVAQTKSHTNSRSLKPKIDSVALTDIQVLFAGPDAVAVEDANEPGRYRVTKYD